MQVFGPTLPLLVLAVLGLTIAAENSSAQTSSEIRGLISKPGNPSQSDLKVIDGFLKSQVFGPFTKSANAATYPAIRENFYKSFRNVGKTPAHDFLNQRTLKYAQQYFLGSNGKRFGPAAQYNVLLLIGDLNEMEASNSIKPYLYSLKPLMDTMTLPAEEELEFLKPAALVGLARFAEAKAIPPSVAPQITQSLLDLLTDVDVPVGSSASARDFIRRSAARVLAAMGSPGPDNQVVKAFESIAADPDARITLRCEMSQFIGDLRIPPESKVDLKALANTIGRQMVEIVQQELNRVTVANEPPSRRILMYAVNSGKTGLTGLAQSAENDPDASRFISSVRSKTSLLYDALNNTDRIPDDKLAEATAREIEIIQGLLLPATTAAVGSQGDTTQPLNAN